MWKGCLPKFLPSPSDFFGKGTALPQKYFLFSILILKVSNYNFKMEIVHIHCRLLAKCYNFKILGPPRLSSNKLQCITYTGFDSRLNISRPRPWPD